MRGIPKTQLRLDTEDSSVYANSRSDQFNASTSISAPHDARETHDQSDDDDGDDDDEEGDDADDKGLGEDNREDADAEMHDRGTPQSFERQEHPTANAATTVRRTLSSHSTIQPVVYPSSPHNCIEENLDPTSATTGQWQKELQNGPTYSSTFPTGSAPHGYQDNGNHILALADMEFDLGTFPNFGASIYQHQQPHDPGVPQSNTEASYPDPDTTSGVVMGGVSQIAYGGQPFSKVTHQDKPVQANWPSTRRESAPQQDHDLLRYQGLVDQAPVTPDASPGFSKIESQSAQPSTRNTFSLSSEIPQGPLLRVSIDAECTTDELGNLVRTLVGARKVVIKVH